jgi:hypothetical protein
VEKLIKNVWRRSDGEPLERARILSAAECPEGFDVERVRAGDAAAAFRPEPAVAHVLSVIRGRARLSLPGETLALEARCHVYLPPGAGAELSLDAGAELVVVSAPSADRSRGTKLIVRDETFLSACAAEGCSLRWIFTPQYLSRRIFLHHDSILVSRSGEPVSWFHTTMFDVSGLPPNADGEPVFKMSYNSRTEFNVLYAVEGDARVRTAIHPYGEERWSPWMRLDGDSTYHLNEVEARDGLRNKHEVVLLGGHASLFCMFDPAPTGIERHRPGEYSDYEPFEAVSARPEYEIHRRQIARFDAMVDELSLAKARGLLDKKRNTQAWELYEAGRATQADLERALIAEHPGRSHTLERWRSF